jgi:hypothetical protein
MRKELEKISDTNMRARFTGVFERYGVKRGWRGQEEETILLKNIKDEDGNIIADHLWFNHTLGFWSLGELTRGDVISFVARATLYRKGVYGCRTEFDYQLSRPTKIRRVKPTEI